MRLFVLGLAVACSPQPESDCVFWFYADQDGDGRGALEPTVTGCIAPPGYETTHDDCDDGDSAVHPGAPERCNGIDDDCDGHSDSSVVYYADLDRDGYGNDDDQYCDTPPIQHAFRGGDCDDQDTHAHPDAAERCNGIDDDCDAETDEGVLITSYVDADGDGYGHGGSLVMSCEVPEGTTSDSTDCDDREAAVHPDAEETCNDIDDDCDKRIDDDDDDLDAPAQYADNDGDGFGDPTTGEKACDWILDRVFDAADCDDQHASVNPMAYETCNAIDDDCDGLADDDAPVVTGRSIFYTDGDGDGLGTLPYVMRCVAPRGHVETYGDCDDTDATIGPRTTMYRDSDGDNFGHEPDERCVGPSSGPEWILTGGDCDDARANVFPGAPEVCDDIDDDCDGLADDDDPGLVWPTRYLDNDADGYGASSTATAVPTCALAVGQVAVDGDCDDRMRTTHPGAAEVCVNSVDDDCDGVIDPCPVDLGNADWSLVGPAARSIATRGFTVLATDLNGDGVADLVATAPEIDPPVYAFFGPLSGSATLDDANLTFSSLGATELEGGMGAADVNGDNTTDLLLGAPEDHVAYLFLGPVTSDDDGAADTEFLVPEHGPSATVARILPDFDGDDSPDVTVNAIDLSDLAQQGTVYVAPATTTDSLFSLPRNATYIFEGMPFGELGASIVPIGDTNGDGTDDLAIGATGIYEYGVFVLAGGQPGGTYIMADAASGRVCSPREDRLGQSMAATDYDGDGNADLLVGAPEDAPSVYGFLGPFTDEQSTADAYVRWIGEKGLGYSVAAGGDVDGDDTPDVLLGSYEATLERGAAYLSLRGAEGVVDVTDLLSFVSATDGNLAGYAVEFVPDWSGDDRPEVAFGEPFLSRRSELESGAARVDVVFSENLY
jgi:hypothetical protein